MHRRRKARRPTPPRLDISVEEVNALSTQLAAQAPYDLLVRFAALTGLRAGELAALRIRDIDMLHGEVQVRRNMTDTSTGYVIGSPKSSRGVRDVPILDEGLYQDLAAYLEAHPHRSDPGRGTLAGEGAGHSIISYDHTFDPKGFYRYTFKPAARRAGFPELHLHELRHTFATLALESKALDMHELSRAMGHASYEITDRVYAHLRKKDYSSHCAQFSAHVAAGATPPQPVRLRAAGS